MRQAVLAAEEGRLVAPPRVSADLGQGRVVFTAGALDGEWFGYRSYDTFDNDPGQQLVVLHAADTGYVRAVALGSALGRLRTGALGGLAVSILAPAEAATVGIIGSGHQAWAQIWAISAVRSLQHVSVYSKTPAHAAQFARRVTRELGLTCAVAPTAEHAVRDKHVVVLATSSSTPVVRPEWLMPGSHVTTVGPKQLGAAEFDLALVEASHRVVTDSPAQLDAYSPAAIVAGSRHAGRVESLGVVARRPPSRNPSDPRISLYLSVGLAGTEVYFLSRVVKQHARQLASRLVDALDNEGGHAPRAGSE